VAGEDEFVPHTSELGLPVTTDPEVIAAFLRRRRRGVVFATYQYSPQIAAAYKGRTPRFDLAVADEAHRCAGRVSSEFATILDRDQIKARRSFGERLMPILADIGIRVGSIVNQMRTDVSIVVRFHSDSVSVRSRGSRRRSNDARSHVSPATLLNSAARRLCAVSASA